MAPVPGGVVTRTSLPHLHSPSARSVPEGGPAAGRWWPRARGAIGPAGPGHGSRGQKGGWGGRPRRAVGGGGAQEAAPLGQWGVSELSSADGLECGRGRCPDAYGQGREGGGTGPHARESSRGRTRRRSPGDRGRPQGAVGWHRPWALTRGLGSGPRSWGAGLEAGTGSLGQRVLTSVPPQGPQLRRLCVVSGSASRLGGPRPTMTPLTW